MKGYGEGESTGMDQTALNAIQTGFKPEEMRISSEDREVLRPLAERVAHIAESERMKEIRTAWKAHNDLEPTRPMLMCDPENGWNEIITTQQMRCEGVLARRWEMILRKKIFWGDVVKDDTPVAPIFDVPYTVEPDDWGLHSDVIRAQADGAATWTTPIQDMETQVEKVKLQPTQIDWETSKASLQITDEAFGDILPVHLKGTWWWSLGITMPTIFLRGLENMMMDFYDYPDELKELVGRISDGFLKKLDWLEEQNLLSLNNDETYVGSGGYGHTSQLPAPDFSGKVRCQDLWGFSESQETVSVSPAMYEEFIFPFEKPILDRFGLNCYGCCEPLNTRWDIVKRHKNLRRVSCSPWADYEKMAEMLKADYVFSLKPNPADIAVPDPDFDRIRKTLRRDIEITKGCVVEVIMKDNHTLGKKPENIVEWTRIAREELER
jgi:hypothetical protein